MKLIEDKQNAEATLLREIDNNGYTGNDRLPVTRAILEYYGVTVSIKTQQDLDFILPLTPAECLAIPSISPEALVSPPIIDDLNDLVLFLNKKPLSQLETYFAITEPFLMNKYCRTMDDALALLSTLEGDKFNLVFKLAIEQLEYQFDITQCLSFFSKDVGKINQIHQLTFENIMKWPCILNVEFTTPSLFDHGEYLIKILNMIPIDQRLKFYNKKNRFNVSMLSIAINRNNPEILTAMLRLLPEKECLSALKQPNRNGIPLLLLALVDPKFAEAINSVFPNAEGFAHLISQDDLVDCINDTTHREHLLQQPELLRAIFKKIQTEKLLELLVKNDNEKSPVLSWAQLLAKDHIEILEEILVRLSPQEQLSAVSRGYGYNGYSLLLSALLNPQLARMISSLFRNTAGSLNVSEDGAGILHLIEQDDLVDFINDTKHRERLLQQPELLRAIFKRIQTGKLLESLIKNDNGEGPVLSWAQRLAKDHIEILEEILVRLSPQEQLSVVSRDGYSLLLSALLNPQLARMISRLFRNTADSLNESEAFRGFLHLIPQENLVYFITNEIHYKPLCQQPTLLIAIFASIPSEKLLEVLFYTSPHNCWMEFLSRTNRNILKDTLKLLPRSECLSAINRSYTYPNGRSLAWDALFEYRYLASAINSVLSNTKESPSQSENESDVLHFIQEDTLINWLKNPSNFTRKLLLQKPHLLKAMFARIPREILSELLFENKDEKIQVLSWMQLLVKHSIEILPDILRLLTPQEQLSAVSRGYGSGPEGRPLLLLALFNPQLASVIDSVFPNSAYSLNKSEDGRGFLHLIAQDDLVDFINDESHRKPLLQKPKLLRSIFASIQNENLYHALLKVPLYRRYSNDPVYHSWIERLTDGHLTEILTEVLGRLPPTEKLKAVRHDYGSESPSLLLKALLDPPLTTVINSLFSNTAGNSSESTDGRGFLHLIEQNTLVNWLYNLSSDSDKFRIPREQLLQQPELLRAIFAKIPTEKLLELLIKNNNAGVSWTRLLRDHTEILSDVLGRLPESERLIAVSRGCGYNCPPLLLSALWSPQLAGVIKSVFPNKAESLYESEDGRGFLHLIAQDDLVNFIDDTRYHEQLLRKPKLLLAIFTKIPTEKLTNVLTSRGFLNSWKCGPGLNHHTEILTKILLLLPELDRLYVVNSSFNYSVPSLVLSALLNPQLATAINSAFPHNEGSQNEIENGKGVLHLIEQDSLVSWLNLLQVNGNEERNLRDQLLQQPKLLGAIFDRIPIKALLRVFQAPEKRFYPWARLLLNNHMEILRDSLLRLPQPGELVAGNGYWWLDQALSNPQLAEVFSRMFPNPEGSQNESEDVRGILSLNPHIPHIPAWMLSSWVEQAVNQAVNKEQLLQKPAVLRVICSRIPKDELLEILTQKHENSTSFLDRMIAHHDMDRLMAIIALLPENQRFDIVNQRMGEKTILYQQIDTPHFFPLLRLLPADKRREALKEVYDNYDVLEDDNIQFFTEIMALLPEHERLEELRGLVKHGYQLGFNVVQRYPSMFIDLLPTFAKPDQLKILTEESKEYPRILDGIINNPDLLKTILSSLPEEVQLDVILHQPKKGKSLLHKIANNLPSLAAVLRLLSEEDRLKAIHEISSFSQLFKVILNAYSESERLAVLRQENKEGVPLLLDVIRDKNMFAAVLNPLPGLPDTQDRILNAKKILRSMSEEEWKQLLDEKNYREEANIFLEQYIDDPELLMTILDAVPAHLKLTAVNLSARWFDDTVLTSSIKKPDVFIAILKSLNEADRLKALERPFYEGTVLDLLVKQKTPALLDACVRLLHPDDAIKIMKSYQDRFQPRVADFKDVFLHFNPGVLNASLHHKLDGIWNNPSDKDLVHKVNVVLLAAMRPRQKLNATVNSSAFGFFTRDNASSSKASTLTAYFPSSPDRIIDALHQLLLEPDVELNGEIACAIVYLGEKIRSMNPDVIPDLSSRNQM